MLINESLQHHFLLVDLRLQFLLALSPVVLFTFNFVAGADGLQLRILDLLRLLLEHLIEDRNVVVELQNFYMSGPQKCVSVV